MSNTAMKAPSMAPTSATHWRAETVPGCAGVWPASSSLACPSPATRRGSQHTVAASVIDLYLHGSRHTRDQAAFQDTQARAIQFDPNRHSLDNFREIASRIVGRQQRELRSAAGRKAR